MPIPRDTCGIVNPVVWHVTLERFPAGVALEGVVDWFWALRWQIPDGAEHLQQVLAHPAGNIHVGTTDDTGTSCAQPQGRAHGPPTTGRSPQQWCTCTLEYGRG